MVRVRFEEGLNIRLQVARKCNFDECILLENPIKDAEEEEDECIFYRVYLN